MMLTSHDDWTACESTAVSVGSLCLLARPVVFFLDPTMPQTMKELLGIIEERMHAGEDYTVEFMRLALQSAVEQGPTTAAAIHDVALEKLRARIECDYRFIEGLISSLTNLGDVAEGKMDAGEARDRALELLDRVRQDRPWKVH